jgi:hypothetical protein
MEYFYTRGSQPLAGMSHGEVTIDCRATMSKVKRGTEKRKAQARLKFK